MCGVGVFQSYLRIVVLHTWSVGLTGAGRRIGPADLLEELAPLVRFEEFPPWLDEKVRDDVSDDPLMLGLSHWMSGLLTRLVSFGNSEGGLVGATGGFGFLYGGMCRIEWTFEDKMTYIILQFCTCKLVQSRTLRFSHINFSLHTHDLRVHSYG